ncbi:uncharacterized protein LOC118563987 [Fundulus heteroclitus]|uniref:uncharacterized protein LOC118563987 n=1 Tax=Fundulus heteroclitus TaxID=8078 RepID=UPI00165C86D7|nr:uncharacterized protein LOC118563987 [Fundulus heteroclitus]
MAGVKVPCLVDTGSMVSTITESFFIEFFEPWGEERLRACHWLQLKAANGLPIPYIGYLEVSIELCGKLMPHCGVLVVRNPPDSSSASVPGVLGMNVINKCYQELFGQHGNALFNTTPVVSFPKPLVNALQKCHAAVTQHTPKQPSKVRVRGKRACRIPGGVMKIVPTTCCDLYSGTTVLFEPSESGLPAGLLASPALVQVVRGTAYVPVVNVGNTDVLLYPRSTVGTLNSVGVVSLPAGVTEVPLFANVSSQTVAAPASDGIKTIDLSSLSEEEQGRVRALLGTASSWCWWWTFRVVVLLFGLVHDFLLFCLVSFAVFLFF